MKNSGGITEYFFEKISEGSSEIISSGYTTAIPLVVLYRGISRELLEVNSRRIS